MTTNFLDYEIIAAIYLRFYIDAAGLFA